jgi:hypothetical protein
LNQLIASYVLEKKLVGSISGWIKVLDEFAIGCQVHVVQLWHSYFCARKEVALHFDVVGVEAASVVVLDNSLWFPAVNAVLILPAHKKRLVRLNDVLTCELSESQRLNDVSYVDFLVELLPCINKLLVLYIPCVKTSQSPLDQLIPRRKCEVFFVLHRGDHLAQVIALIFGFYFCFDFVELVCHHYILGVFCQKVVCHLENTKHGDVDTTNCS